MRIWRIAVRIGHFVFKLPILLNFYRFAREILYKLVGSTDYLKAQGAKKEILKTILRQDIKAILPFVKASTLIIWAEKDKQTPLRWAKIFEEAVPNSQLKIVKGAGHVFPYYNGQQFVDLITDFLFET